MTYTFTKDFIVLGYRENTYTDKQGNCIEQYILNIAYSYDKYHGLHVGQAYVKRDLLKDIDLTEKLEDFLFHAVCSYNKRLQRLYVEKIVSIEDVG